MNTNQKILNCAFAFGIIVSLIAISVILTALQHVNIK